MNNIFLTLFLLVGLNTFSQSDQFFIKVDNIHSVDRLSEHPQIVSFGCPFRLREMQSTFLIELSDSIEINQLERWLSGKITYEYIEEVPRIESFYTPNDLQGSQYALTMINAAQAWDLNLNASNARIAVIDDAIDLTHPDLAGNIWINPNEIPGDGMDNDFNGFIDDVTGWDFADNDNNPNPPSAIMGHGTHVTGIASATTDNGIGVASIGMNAKIVPIKIGLDATGGLVNGIQAIDYAISIGVDVINMSWGGGIQSQTYQNIFDIAHNEEIVCVAAAGNSSSPVPMYPASYNFVISVASTNASDQASVFTNYGSTVDLAAPGSDIYSTKTGATPYGNLSGTSMASPCVAGLVALMRDANPLATADEIEACLVSTCDPITGPLSTQVGAGRINAYQAMLCITEPTAEFTSDVTQVCPGNSISFFNYSAWPGTTYSWSFPGGVPATSSLQNPVINYPTGGVFDVTLTVTNGMFTQTITMTNYVTITEPSAVISGLSSIVSGGYGSVSVNLTGIPPFAFTISDGTTNYPITGVTNSPYVQYFNPTVDTDYTISNLSDSQCTGTTSGLGTIAVTTGTSTMCDSSSIAFIKYLGTNIDDVSKGVADLGQHGYLVYGRKQFSSTNMRMYIARLDKCGNVLWENIYDQNMYGFPVAAYIDGNEIIICGCHGSTNTVLRSILMRLDLNGNVIDAKRIGGSNNTTYARYMGKYANGDYAMGSVINSTPGIGGNDNYIVRTQADGTIIWQKRIGTNNNVEFFFNIFIDQAQNAVITGYTTLSGVTSGYVMKLDPSGNLLWSKKYNTGSGLTYLDHVIELNGSYYATGSANQLTYGNVDGILIKIDPSDGSIIWSKKMGGTGYDKLGDMAVYNDTLYIMGFSNSGATSNEVTLLRYDQSGNLIDYSSFGTPIDDFAWTAAQQLRTTADGDWLGVATGNAGVLGGNDLILFKFNNYIDICQPSTVTVQSSPIAIQLVNYPVTVQTPTWAFSPLAITVTPVISNQGFACINVTSVPCAVTADFSASTVICINDSVQFTDLSTPIDSTDINYWDFGDATNSGFVPSGDIAHLYSSPGTYNVQLIAMDTITGCADTIVQSITVTSTPSIDLPDTLYGCLYDTLQIDLMELCLSPQATVTWSPDSIITAYIGNDITIEINYFGYVYVTVVDNGVTLTDSVYIAESPNCCTSIPIIDPPIAVCVGEPLTFTESSITNGAATFTWSFLPDGNPLSWTGSTPPDVIFNTTGSKQVILTLNDACGIHADTVNLSIVDPPIFELGPDIHICEDSVLQLGELPVDNWIYLWQPGFAVSDSIISNPTATINTDQLISVSVTDPWTGCTTYDTLFVYLDTITINLGADLAFCDDTLLQLGLPTEPNWDYNWQPTSITSDPAIADPTFDITSTETLILVVTDTLTGCSDSDTMDVIVEVISVDLGPDVVFCSDTTIILGPVSSPDYTYAWEPAALVSDPTSANPSYTATGNDDLSLVMTTILAGCTASDTINYSIDPVFVDILLDDTLLCAPYALTIQVDHSGFYDVLWQPTSLIVQQNFNSVDVLLTDDAVIYATAFSLSGNCIDVDSVSISLQSAPEPINIDTLICDDEPFMYSPNGTWFSGSQSVGLVTLNEAGVYTYQEDHACGTTFHEIAISTTTCDCNVYIPNAFTPDGGEHNNAFFVVSDCVFEEFHMTIYDRWGELIFESYDKIVGWDGTFKGKTVQDGTYTWKLKYIDTINETPEEIVGHVNVIR